MLMNPFEMIYIGQKDEGEEGKLRERERERRKKRRRKRKGGEKRKKRKKGKGAYQRAEDWSRLTGNKESLSGS